MRWMDRVVAWNAQSSAVEGWSVPRFLLKAVIVYLMVGVLMAIIVPVIHSQGVALRGWMIGAVLIASIVIVNTDVYRRRRSR